MVSKDSFPLFPIDKLSVKNPYRRAVRLKAAWLDAQGGALIQKRNSAPAVCAVCRSLFQFSLHGRDASVHAFMLIDRTHPFKIVSVNGSEFVLIDAHSFSQAPDARIIHLAQAENLVLNLRISVPSRRGGMEIPEYDLEL